jgi:hypothetical protein
MPTTIKLKNSVTTTNAPSSLAQGEVAINVTDKKVWVGNAATTPVQLLGTGADGSLSTLTVGAGTVSLPSITTTGDTNTGIFFPAADTIAFSEGGAESMRITDAGNVGIGTSSIPSSVRLYQYVTAGTCEHRIESSNTSGVITRWKQNGVDVGYAASANTTVSGGSATDFAISAPTANLVFATGTSERMRIDSSGNVGIGATSPRNSSRVTIDGTNDATSKISLYRSDTGSALQVGSNYIGTWSNSVFEFYTNAAERMRIDSSGNLLVGATAPPFSNANFADGSTYVNGNAFINNSSGTSQYNVRFDGYSDQLFVVWSNGNTQSNSIYYAYGGTAWVNSSDEALKDIIEPITNAVDKVSQLRSVIGKYKTEEEGARHPFLIAQDVQKVLPEAVYLNKSRVEGEPDTLGVGYTDVIPLLVAAIQEQQAIITDLKSRIEALESK